MQPRTNKTARLLAGAGLAALLAFPATAFAQGTMGKPSGGTGGTTGTYQSGTEMNMSAPNGGNSESRMSTQGRMNTNGPNATDRSYGKDRACDRHQMHSGTSTTDTTGINCPTDRTPGTTPDTMNAKPETGTGATTPPSQ